MKIGTFQTIVEAWGRIRETGTEELGDGYWIQTGKDINSMLSDEEIERGDHYDEDQIYLTVDMPADPVPVDGPEDTAREISAFYGFALRYVIVDQRDTGDIFEHVLEENDTLQDAIACVEAAWSALTEKEKESSTMELGFLVCEENEDHRLVPILDDSRWYGDACILGWDTLTAWTPLFALKGEDRDYFINWINEKTLTDSEKARFYQAIKDELNHDWEGGCYNDDMGEYHGQITLKGRTVTFSVDASIKGDDMIFGDYVTAKRTR